LFCESFVAKSVPQFRHKPLIAARAIEAAVFRDAVLINQKLVGINPPVAGAVPTTPGRLLLSPQLPDSVSGLFGFDRGEEPSDCLGCTECAREDNKTIKPTERNWTRMVDKIVRDHDLAVMGQADGDRSLARLLRVSNSTARNIIHGR
jgi:hypothetical protein